MQGLIRLAAGSGEFRYMMGGDYLKRTSQVPDWIEVGSIIGDLLVCTGQSCAVQLQVGEEWELVFRVQNFGCNKVMVFGAKSTNPVMERVPMEEQIVVENYDKGVKYATVKVTNDRN
jgi:hypothetical protein